MNAFIKTIIFNGLKARFPGFKSILINIPDKKVLIETEHGSRTEDTGTTDEKYFIMLAESKGLKFIKDIYVNKEKDCIVVRGDKDVVL